MKKYLLLSLALFISCIGVIQINAQTPVLKFQSGKPFKIVQFTDVHWVPKNKKSQEAKVRMNEILDAEKPDLVLYTGDIIYGKPAESGLREAFEPVISRGIPFGIMFGNHDDEQDMTRRQIFEYVKTRPGNVTETAEGITGVGNYILPIKSSDGQKNAAVLYCMDSNAYSTIKGVDGYGWFDPSQIEWYKANSKEFTTQNGGTPLPSLAFFHIPLPEYNLAAEDESTFLLGARKERACAPKINTGMFAAMLNAGDIMGTFVGHDHINDYVAYWKGILLCYGRFTGGDTVYNGLPGGNGARVIELTEGERGFKTWIRLKDNVIAYPVVYPDDFIKKGNNE